MVALRANFFSTNSALSCQGNLNILYIVMISNSPTLRTIWVTFICDACDKRSHGFTFRCEDCDFDLDLDCALAKPEVRNSITHFSHEHVLALMEDDFEREVWCKACEKHCLSPAYVCKECEYFLHESCAELPLERISLLHPIHPLKLQVTAYDGRVYCDYCERKVLGFTYHCEQCHFDLDVECANVRILATRGQIEHFGHRHALVPCEKTEKDKVRCEACQEVCSGDAFGCERCEYFLHKTCAELPIESNNPVHKEHPLKLQVALANICDHCEKRIRGYTYRCDPCDFDLDVRCALELAKKPELWKVHQRKKEDEKDAEIWLHFAHEHKLKRSSKLDEKKHRCMACDKLCSGVVYSCTEKCEFFLHESCAELPRQFKHYFHEHVLFLQSKGQDVQKMDEAKVTCRACEKSCRGFTFSCSICNFHMDVECTLMATRKRRIGYIGHFCHGHPLKIIKGEKPGPCSACEKPWAGVMYSCNKCRMWLHKSCADALKKKINHFFHRHELSLNNRVRNVKCKACRKECQGFTFNCEDCDFNLDIACALMPMRDPDGHKYRGHGHPLKLVDKGGVTDIRCSVCKKFCSGSTYECPLCDFYIHKACDEELEETITHDFHPKHQLELKTKVRFKCGACLKESSGFTYDCDLCRQFSLHKGCAHLKPIIKYNNHHHPLAFFESLYEKGKLRCSADHCKSEIPCSIERQSERANVVRCVQCNYNFHLLCSPLPCTISSKKHKHPITLKNTFIEEGSDESYCDACEKKRDPQECVYKCEQCPYVAAFDCMESEVIELLKGKENHVRLRSLREGFTGEVITEGIRATDEMVQKEKAEGNDVERGGYIENVVCLDDMFDYFVEDKAMNLAGRVDLLEKEMVFLRDQIRSIVPNASSYSYAAMMELMARLKTSVQEAEFSMIFFEEEETERVEGFFTVKSLVPTLKQLLDQHKDIISRSEQSSKSKNLVLTMLCGAVRSMLELDGKMERVSEALLFNWWNHFILAECAGFEIQFLMDHLKRITLAYCAVKAKEVQRQKLEELAGEIGELEQTFRSEEVKLESIFEKEQRILSDSARSTLSMSPSIQCEVLEENLPSVVVN